MRQHKFRVWDKKAKKMYFPTEENDLMLLIGDSGFYQVQNHGNYNIKTAKYKDLRVVDSLDDDLVIMEWTGLKDKNKKNIYEGDIYIAERSHMKSRGYKSKKYPDRIKVRCIVEWDMEDAKWYAKEIGPLPEYKEADENAPYHYYHTGLGSENGICDWVEVEGNIFDNPDLVNPF